VKERTDNTMMHLLVEDVRSRWRHIESLDLANQFDVSPPVAPRDEPWGLTVAYVVDPSSVLWRFAEETKAAAQIWGKKWATGSAAASSARFRSAYR
jgi:hypothetical protein